MKKLLTSILLIAFLSATSLALFQGRAQAAPLCFQTTSTLGVTLYVSAACPNSSIIDANSSKCYVSDSGLPTPYANALTCFDAMARKMQTTGAIPDGCPYGRPIAAGGSADSAQHQADSKVCPYLNNQFGTVNPAFTAQATNGGGGANGAGTDGPCSTVGSTCVAKTDDQAVGCTDKEKCDFTTAFINPAIQFLSAGVGVVVIIMIIIAGIQYSSAGGDPQKVAAARQRITNALFALVVYIFFFAIIQWLLPNGIL